MSDDLDMRALRRRRAVVGWPLVIVFTVIGILIMVKVVIG